MALTVARFDLDETVPAGNIPRSARSKTGIPTGMPFVFDDVAMEPVEPTLLFLVDEYAKPGMFTRGRWTKNNSASAAATDLMDWWTKLQATRVPWDCADDGLLASWLTDMKMTTSGTTGDWLDEKTINRRLSTITKLYRWALGRGLVEQVPQANAAKRIADSQLTSSQAQRQRAQARRSVAVYDPHPISAERSAGLARALGPLPSERKGRSSRTRLSYELGMETGLRIDEILHLLAAFFLGFKYDAGRPFVMTSLRVEHTKGLVPREANVPAWLMHEICLYIEGERAAAILCARRMWLNGEQEESPYLLLNHADAGHNAGKQTQAATIQGEFHRACMDLGLTRQEVRAEGTTEVEVVVVPLHTFHDTRHTFAVVYYHALESQGHNRPWLKVQRALGHRDVATTIHIYLSSVDGLGDKERELVALAFNRMRNDRRGGYAAPAT